MKPIGQLNTAHDMYQRAKRAKRSCAPLYVRIPPQTDPRANGSQGDREEWMRERQQAKDERKQTKRALTRFADTRTRLEIAKENERVSEIEGKRKPSCLEKPKTKSAEGAPKRE